MRITTVRRISQIFFILLFLWFCAVTAPGERWWQLRGWPVNWLLQLDPLHGLGVWLATHTVYSGLLWGVATLALTFIVGRFFCGWLCPFGALQQFMGFLGKRGLRTAQKIARNRPHPFQRMKYWILLFLLAAAAADLLHLIFRSAHQTPLAFWALLAGGTVLAALLKRFKLIELRKDVIVIGAAMLISGVALDLGFPHGNWLAASLQTGLLDPIALMHRSVNVALLPLLDNPATALSALPRVYPGAGVIGALFLTFTVISLRIPRFYCRFICPLGALFGLLTRWSLWRIGKKDAPCKNCQQCERDCEGACQPTGTIQTSECVLCLNCLAQCRHGVMGFNTAPSTAGEMPVPDLTRRQLLTTVGTGLVAAPMLRLSGHTGTHWHPAMIRPPGALAESEFLARCIKCGQCMRICPTNVIHPAGLKDGIEALWTPLLNYRTGSSGCQHNCVACSHICPTAAIRPLTVDERTGQGEFVEKGPVRIGMAFVDRGRCLPWAMDTPCIVCQENCPVSPKAIFTRTVLQPVRDGRKTIKTISANQLVLDGADMAPGRYGTGDYFCRAGEGDPIPIKANTNDTLAIDAGTSGRKNILPGQTAEIVIRLQQPQVDPRQCIGCGVCEHECPVQGLRAIRVTAENESRQREHRMVI